MRHPNLPILAGLLLGGALLLARPAPTGAANSSGAVPAANNPPAAVKPVRDPKQAGVLWFAPTGHTLRGGFRAFWEQHGGLAQFGYPLTEEFQEYSPPAGRYYTVQYFERNRFEWHPENAGTPNEFLLGLLGSELTGKAGFPLSPPFGSSASHRYFPQTGHSIGGVFLTYWQQHGGLALYGLPISEEIEEQIGGDGRVYLVQYFQRNRFELHPEDRGTPAEVQLGRLGADLLRSRGWLQ
jgi:hypothetical protein